VIPVGRCRCCVCFCLAAHCTSPRIETHSGAAAVQPVICE
jgi:hypothetical protein